MKELKGGTDDAGEVTDVVVAEVLVLDEVDTPEVTPWLEIVDEVAKDAVGEFDVTV